MIGLEKGSLCPSDFDQHFCCFVHFFGAGEFHSAMVVAAAGAEVGTGKPHE